MITLFGKEVPTELHEIVDPSHTAFLIIDMQNDFCCAGGGSERFGGDLGMYPKVIASIAAFADISRAQGVPVIHLQNIRLPNGLSDSPAWMRVRMRGAKATGAPTEDIFNYAVEGTWGAEIVPELTPRPNEVVIKKFRSSGFHSSPLDLVLRANGIKTVLVSGCTTEGCVDSTVRDIGFSDYFPVVLSDCVATDNEDLHNASMLVMAAYRADVATSADVVDAWRTSAVRMPQAASR